jgi:serine phosphatase RsbU (regulator of sigma subunit)
MSTRLKALLKLPTTRLSRRVVFWVFVSVIVIEAIILIPSYRNRQKELLSQLTALSSAKVAVIGNLTPAVSSDATLMNYIEVLSQYAIIAGGAVFDYDGRLVGEFGEAPTLTYSDVHDNGRSTLLSADGTRYDMFYATGYMPNDYSLILRHDASSVKKELYAFILRIAGLVLIISIFVTAGAWIALDPIVITPILNLRKDLTSAGEAISKDQGTPSFYSASVQREDELGDVIAAFNQMYRRIVDAVSERKQAEKALQISFEQVEAYSLAMRKELEKGRRMQTNFLPQSLPEKDGWEIAAFFKPARQVAGDFYDAFELPDGRVALVVADVCDKGVGAALFMGLFRSLLRVFSGRGELGCIAAFGKTMEARSTVMSQTLSAQDPMLAVKLTNDYVARNHSDLTMFATIFFGVLDLESGCLTYINGGQEPVQLIGAEGEIRESLGPTGPAVGVYPEVEFQTAETRLAPGEILLVYTDGVTEATDPAGELFSTARILRLLDRHAESAQALIDRIGKRVLTHTGKSEQSDDITLLAVQRHPSTA